MAAIIPLEQITKMVVNLREPAQNMDKVGTGMLVIFNGRPFILTAKHVAHEITINGMVVVKGVGDIPVVIPIKKLSSNSLLVWKHHHEADLLSLRKLMLHTIRSVTWFLIDFYRYFGKLRKLYHATLTI